MTDPQTWNEIARQCADLQAENAELRKRIEAQVQTDCPYCHEPTLNMDAGDGECHVHKCIDGAAIFLFYKHIVGHIDINFCPMCGRRLNDSKRTV